MTSGMSRRAAVHAIAGLATIGLAAPHIARAAVRTVRCGHNQTMQSHYGRGTLAFAEAVAADPVLRSVIVIEADGNAQLGDEFHMLTACANGTIDTMLCSGSIAGNLVPDIGMLNAPFLFPDAEHARAVLDGAMGQEIAATARTKGIAVLAWGENGLRHITANQPIRTPLDLKGLKLRVPQSEIMLQGMRALGADANPLSFDLLREALRTGLFQAQENPIVTIESAKIYEVHKYLNLTGHIYDAACFVASSDLMEDLSDAQRTALVACAKQGALVTRQVASEAQRTGIARLQSAGMTVVTDVDAQAFRKAALPYLEGLTAKFDADRVKRLIAAT